VRRALALSALLLVAAGCGGSSLSSSSSSSSPSRRYSANVTNAWFPLRPGAVWVYRGVKDGEASRDVVRVTSIVRVIDGAPTVGVFDRLYLSGKLEERTTDYYTPVLDHTFYLRGVGTVLEQTVKGGQERNELVSYRSG
jgi:hypothetical protein